ncbi:MAG: fasciclin domain-containing protein [Ferruginibacter sp.]|nr:fasciclin domain-containing protein [Cytophagales bacterium]
MKKQLIAAIALSLTLGATNFASAQTTPDASAKMTKADLAGSAALSPDHTTLLAALKAAGLADRAKAKGPYTIFAPSNAAFDKLPAGTLDNLLKPANKKTLSGILTTHVVEGSVKAADLQDGQSIKTVSGQTLTVSKQGDSVMIKDAQGNSATVTSADIQATNGIVHSIDAVLMPAPAK